MYSLVMTAFNGRYPALQDAWRNVFGPHSLGPTFTLAYDTEGRYLPVEIQHDLDLEEAERIARLLTEAGATIRIVPEADIAAGAEPVKHRWTEIWPMRHATNGWSFSEVEEGIFVGAPLNLRENFETSRKHGRPCWAIERGQNHQHPTTDFDRQALRKAREMGADLAEALREQYPLRAFVIDYRDEQVSFYQWEVGLPETEKDSQPPLPDTEFCVACAQRRPYQLRIASDSEFPHADWGDCLVCGAEVLLRTRPSYEFIGPVP